MDFDGGAEIQPAAGTDGKAVANERSRRLNGVFITDIHFHQSRQVRPAEDAGNAIHHSRNARTESGRDTTTFEITAECLLDWPGHHRPDGRMPRLQAFIQSDERSAGADTAHDGIDLLVLHLIHDFAGGVEAMGIGVFDILKFPGRNAPARRRCARPRRSNQQCRFARAEINFSAVAPDDQHAFIADALGHDGQEFCAQLRAGQRHGDARRAAGGFDDPLAWLEGSFIPGFAKDVAGDAVLGRAARIEEFELAPNGRAGSIELDRHKRHRRIASR